MSTTDLPRAGGVRVHDRRADTDTARGADVAALRSVLSTLTDDAVAHPRTVHQPECRATRAAMHDYIKGRLVPSRQRRVGAHLDRCGPCTRVFIDVREVSWALRGLGRRLAADGNPGGRHRAPKRADTTGRA
ncbi:zf-HC2 domain-containing protein [Promicromonospora panici]|uniref:zf-HC2 domain-containing protein n=1 Tax=Promicromonospora panici TaxID=2219658 RepID=UPI00101B6E78|nr:zf-HC2 domain-containing protein [Promicromonospora panici]